MPDPNFDTPIWQIGAAAGAHFTIETNKVTGAWTVDSQQNDIRLLPGMDGYQIPYGVQLEEKQLDGTWDKVGSVRDAHGSFDFGAGDFPKFSSQNQLYPYRMRIDSQPDHVHGVLAHPDVTIGASEVLGGWLPAVEQDSVKLTSLDVYKRQV